MNQIHPWRPIHTLPTIIIGPIMLILPGAIQMTSTTMACNDWMIRPPCMQHHIQKNHIQMWVVIHRKRDPPQRTMPTNTRRLPSAIRISTTSRLYQYTTAPVSNPNLNNESVVGGGDSSTVPDIMVLNVLCAQVTAPKDVNHEESVAEAEESWQAVREWLSSNNAETVRAAAEQRGESGLTALHFACRNVPPLDVINFFLSIPADTVQWPDSFGWLPVQYACASGYDTAVIQALTESFPESKTTTDRRQRNTLHFAVGEKRASPDVFFCSVPREPPRITMKLVCWYVPLEKNVRTVVMG